MSAEWGRIFDAYGVKRVTKTDKEKEAYVLTKEQLHAVEMTGIKPAVNKPSSGFEVVVLCERNLSFVNASYYHAERRGAGRPPEPRMGRAFIASWLEVGDRVLLGSVGAQLFALKLPVERFEEDFLVREVLGRASRETVLGRARKANGTPARRVVQREEFVRDPWVVQAAVIRANDRCEMPDCSSELFMRSDGSIFLEVHHVTPLGEGGEDSLANVAALCPRCHREIHFGAHRVVKRVQLAAFLCGENGG